MQVLILLVPVLIALLVLLTSGVDLARAWITR